MMQSLTLWNQTYKGVLTQTDMELVGGVLHTVQVCMTVLPISKQACHLV